MEQSGPRPPLPVSALATPRWNLGTEASGLHEEFHLAWRLNYLCPVKALLTPLFYGKRWLPCGLPSGTVAI